jgi:trehalose 6-phosphate phosphatase
MKHILSRASRAELLRFARSKVLVALDYDGTLAKIVSEPERAVMCPTTRRLLARTAALYPCIVLSGRARADAARLLRGIRLRATRSGSACIPIRRRGSSTCGSTARPPRAAISHWR